MLGVTLRDERAKVGSAPQAGQPSPLLTIPGCCSRRTHASRFNCFFHGQLKPQPQGTRQSGIPAGDTPLAQLPASAVLLCASHLLTSLNTFFRCPPGLPAEQEQTSQPSGQGHKSPTLAEAPCALLTSGGSGQAPPGLLRHFWSRLGCDVCCTYIPQGLEHGACLNKVYRSEAQSDGCYVYWNPGLKSHRNLTKASVPQSDRR